MKSTWHEVISVNPDDGTRLLSRRHATPHDVLGCHKASHGGQRGVVLRVLHPDAVAASANIHGERRPLEPAGAPGLFATFIAGLELPQHPEVSFSFSDGAVWTCVDPYSFWPTLGDQDLYLFGEGKHFRVWHALGARAREHEGHVGTAFAVWAPNAVSVSLVCDANGWDGRLWPMRAMGSSGVFELFAPGVGEGTRYQFEIKAESTGQLRKSDPYAEAADHPPGRASIVTRESQYRWGDDAHMSERPHRDLGRRAINVYEVHPGSFRRNPDGSPLNYRQLADTLIPHMQHFGFTHLELMPICEHPFDGSWGYQVTGFYAPSARFGTPDDFRYLVDRCHQHGIDVIIDWVPAHFPKDDFALARFDGTALYEHADPRQGEHPDWGTLIFNYGRAEVANFLVGSALYFLQEFHVDGLRVDAVASMLYLDYSREYGDWVPNAHGGRENLEAIEFLRHLNAVIADRVPGAYTIAEESTAFAGVTASVQSGGLGFAFKWNMGWMHDTLVYFGRDPVHRQHHQNDLTFANVYEHSERFLMPLSHDEVVHGKGSLLAKMPGDRWQKFANLRTLLTYQYTRPGKKLVFMGSEFAPEGEWDHREALPWPDAHDHERQAFMRFFAALGQLYARTAALYRSDVDEGGFRFIDTTDHAQSVLSYVRTHGHEHVLVVLNLTPVPRSGYRVGAPQAGAYHTVLDSDDAAFGGSEWQGTERATTEAVEMHGCEQSVVLDLPPLGALVLALDEPEEQTRARALGIAEHYFTIDGRRHATSIETRRAFINMLGDPIPEGSPMRPETELSVYSAAESLEEGGQALGIWVQLYAMHSEHSWGIGDLSDLRRLLRWAGELGLDFIGLNPLHAIAPTDQPAIPYHPTSRLFESPLYIDVAAVPEYRMAQERSTVPADIERRRVHVRQGTDVDYPAVFQLKRDALRLAHAELLTLPVDHPRRTAIAEFANRGGQTLQRFAVFCALQAAHADASTPSASYYGFPEPLRDVESQAAARFAREHAQEVAFQVYLQFLVDEQFEAAAQAASEAGMRIGLYLDLAVGTAHGGFDPWAFPSLYVPEASLGAPADDLAPQGQDWGLVPMHPQHLLAEGCQHFRMVLRAAMRHAGALRIDHAMGLTRQFWHSRSHDQPGTYITFPARAMLDVLAEESQRARCVVIAEDLGTVPEGFRDALRVRGILRYEVLHFARGQDGEFPSSETFDRQALLCLSTHDLPTFGEYWRGADLLLRRDLGVFDQDEMLARVQMRVEDKAALSRWLERHDRSVDEGADPQDVLKAVHGLLAAAPSLLLCLSLDDLTAEPHAVNVPGTSPDQGFVSFARRMRHSLEQILSDPELSAAIRDVRAQQTGRPPT
ncbi:MAG: 1,4-alpha-glucan branching protein GlgB [Myxococcales bacterium]|nr:1,4-alpha-glucan branching protein GlgB [Myxococcales bacterium]